MKESRTAYAYLIGNMQKPSFLKVWDIAFDFIHKLPSNLCDELHESLNRGVNLLHSEPQLLMYIYAYGKMHKQKMDIALSQFSWKDFENKQIQIVDWGCGQALATVCFFDYLKRKGIKCEITKIVLIEPSKEALERATTHVYAYDNVSDITDVVTLNKYIDDVELSEIESNAELTIHFFSNVLDVPKINLKRLAKIVQKSSDNESVVICIGPCNNYNKKIDTFYTYFNDNELLYEFEHDKTNKYDYTAKYCIFTLNKKKKKVHFDFDDALTIMEFYKKNKVTKGSRKFLIKTCQPEPTEENPNPEPFKALGLATGDTLDDGRPEYKWFVLSKALEEQGVELTKSFLKEHKDDLMLLEVIDDFKFGIAFLAAGAEDFEEL